MITFAVERERHRHVPRGRRQRRQALGQRGVPAVQLEDLRHRRRHRRLGPADLAALEAVDQRDLLADDQPGNLPGRPRLRIRPVVGALRDALEHRPGGLELLRPQLQEEVTDLVGR
jgi:hypothetical protein